MSEPNTAERNQATASSSSTQSHPASEGTVGELQSPRLEQLNPQNNESGNPSAPSGSVAPTSHMGFTEARLRGRRANQEEPYLLRPMVTVERSESGSEISEPSDSETTKVRSNVMQPIANLDPLETTESNESSIVDERHVQQLNKDLKEGKVTYVNGYIVNSVPIETSNGKFYVLAYGKKTVDHRAVTFVSNNPQLAAVSLDADPGKEQKTNEHPGNNPVTSVAPKIVEGKGKGRGMISFQTSDLEAESSNKNAGEGNTGALKPVGVGYRTIQGAHMGNKPRIVTELPDVKGTIIGEAGDQTYGGNGERPSPLEVSPPDIAGMDRPGDEARNNREVAILRNRPDRPDANGIMAKILMGNHDASRHPDLKTLSTRDIRSGYVNAGEFLADVKRLLLLLGFHTAFRLHNSIEFVESPDRNEALVNCKLSGFLPVMTATYVNDLLRDAETNGFNPASPLVSRRFDVNIGGKMFPRPSYGWPQVEDSKNFSAASNNLIIHEDDWHSSLTETTLLSLGVQPRHFTAFKFLEQYSPHDSRVPVVRASRAIVAFKTSVFSMGCVAMMFPPLTTATRSAEGTAIPLAMRIMRAYIFKPEVLATRAEDCCRIRSIQSKIGSLSTPLFITTPDDHIHNSSAPEDIAMCWRLADAFNCTARDDSVWNREFVKFLDLRNSSKM